MNLVVVPNISTTFGQFITLVDLPGPIYFMLMQFSETFGQIIGVATLRLTPLDNSGSAAA